MLIEQHRQRSDHGGSTSLLSSITCYVTSPGTDGSCVRVVSNKLKRRCNVGRLPNTKRESVAIDAASGNIRWLRIFFRICIRKNCWYQCGNNFHHSSSFVIIVIIINNNNPQGGQLSTAFNERFNGGANTKKRKGHIKILLRSWNENINNINKLISYNFKLKAKAPLVGILFCNWSSSALSSLD